MSVSRPTLNLIGAGRLGAALAAMWVRRGVFEIADVLTRSHASASFAVSRIGAGNAQACLEDLTRSDFLLIAVPDDRIVEIVLALLRYPVLLKDCVVFHCSGARDSTLLRPLSELGARIASAHPLMTFASAAGELTGLGSALCALEGDAGAIAALAEAFRGIDGEPVEISAQHKLTYHAAAVCASNYLVTLLASAEEAFVCSGMTAEQSVKAMRPLVEQTLQNFWLHGPRALTGPIARGDFRLVREESAHLAVLDPCLALLYQCLGRSTARMAGRPIPGRSL